MDGFHIKKILSMFVYPIPGLLLCLLFVLLLRRWMPRFSAFVSISLCLLLIALSVPTIGNRFVSVLENQHPVLQALPEDTGLILVLGYGHAYRDDRPVNSILSSVALSRLVEGVRLWKTRPNLPLVVSGAAPHKNSPSHAQMMAEMAMYLGVPENKIVRFDNTFDTEAEITAAMHVMEAQSNKRLVVVSSASHLPRAALLLDYREASYSMAPTDFMVYDNFLRLPNAYVLLAVNRAVHEWVGIAWYKLKYKINFRYS